MLDVDAISTEELTNKGFQWRNAEGQVQHDAHELNRLLIDALEKSLRKTSGENLCQKLYQGMLVNKTKCLHCNQTSEKYESFYDILLQVFILIFNFIFFFVDHFFFFNYYKYSI